MIPHIRQHPSQHYAFITGKQVVSYGQLVTRMEAIAEVLAKQAWRPLVFLYATNTLDALLVYLACLDADIPICLLEPNPAYMSRLVAHYQPTVLVLPPDYTPPGGYSRAQSLPGCAYAMHVLVPTQTPTPPNPALALLLQTSGSTGAPKLVRLTRDNVFSNALAIAEYLDITPDERGIQSLPVNYSYGLSLINSHLVAGGCIVLTDHSFMRPEFWQDFNTHVCTSFAGVPFMYETLHRLRFEPSRHPSLRMMTQAGGKLRVDLVEEFYHKMRTSHGKFCVMYGQTEATARIAYVPPDRLAEKSGSIGIAIPGGRIELAPVEGMTDAHELVYHGPNVMMGYAETSEDLQRGDDLHGVLHTGDLATVDAAGFHTIVGRLKRFAKLYGRRINLEDVEVDLEAAFSSRVAAIDGGDSKLIIYTEQSDVQDLSTIRGYLAKHLGVSPTAIEVHKIDAIPVTPSGKKDYMRLLS